MAGGFNLLRGSTKTAICKPSAEKKMSTTRFWGEPDNGVKSDMLSMKL